MRFEEALQESSPPTVDRFAISRNFVSLSSTARGNYVRRASVVAGGGGFIGGHLVAALRARGQPVRAIDVKPLSEWHQVFM